MPKSKDDAILAAARIAGVGNLEPRKRDRLDFHQVHVELLKAALNDAYEAGFTAGVESRRNQ